MLKVNVLTCLLYTQSIFIFFVYSSGRSEGSRVQQENVGKVNVGVGQILSGIEIP